MKNLFTLVMTLSALNAAPLAAQHAPQRFEPSARFREYGVAVIDPLAWAGVAGSTLLDQVRDDPEDWDFSDRALSNASRFVPRSHPFTTE